MNQYVAFLRGINVGGRIIKMADLKACLESLGLARVMTVLATGNVLFESDKAAGQLKGVIEAGLGERFNYPAKVQVIESGRLHAIIDGYPFDSGDEGRQHYVVFMEGHLAADLVAAANRLEGSMETIQAGGQVIYWCVKKGMTLQSPFAKYLTKAQYRDFATTRNLKTLKKIVEKLAV